MRKVLFLFLMFATWYLAAMYRMETLMILAVMEILIFFSMFICMWYFKRNIESGFSDQYIVLKQKEYIACPFWAENRGLLPISRYKIRFTFSYEEEEKRELLSFQGNLDRKKREVETIRIDTPWSGILYVLMEELDTYDYFSLFKSKKMYSDMVQVCILPPERKISIGFSPQTKQNNTQSIQESQLRTGSMTEEFVQTREYVPGDSYRHIHWKQSARTDILQVKEYQEEQQESVFLFLDFYEYEDKDIKEMSAFYEILWALISGLMDEAILWVGWIDDNGARVDRQITNQAAKDELFLELYEKNWSEEHGDVRFEDADTALRFGVDLRLCVWEKEIVHFTLEHYKQELEYTNIML